MESNPKECGCKGIRTCLICESGDCKKSVEEYKETDHYVYCAHCNLCWPSDTSSNKRAIPLYLGQLKLVLDFITEEEEASLIAAIDQIPWMLSQSGRQKQDFGPKVNFKKKKAKIGNFKGLPHFSKTVVERFRKYEGLLDFHPVELCHLEYSPDRGSAIEPHLDDSWIWGERLVTVNLASSAVLTLSPANRDSCRCPVDSKVVYLDKQSATGKTRNRMESACKHYLSCLNLPWTNLNQIASDFVDTESSVLPSDMCGIYRTNPAERNVEIQVHLPPRSLFVLAGCGRHNWFHGIKRQDISSRRLAMTFRELAGDFLEGGSEQELGDELLELGRTFCDV